MSMTTRIPIWWIRYKAFTWTTCKFTIQSSRRCTILEPALASEAGDACPETHLVLVPWDNIYPTILSFPTVLSSSAMFFNPVARLVTRLLDTLWECCIIRMIIPNPHCEQNEQDGREEFPTSHRVPGRPITKWRDNSASSNQWTSTVNRSKYRSERQVARKAGIWSRSPMALTSWLFMSDSSINPLLISNLHPLNNTAFSFRPLHHFANYIHHLTGLFQIFEDLVLVFGRNDEHHAQAGIEHPNQR